MEYANFKTKENAIGLPWPVIVECGGTICVCYNGKETV